MRGMINGLGCASWAVCLCVALLGCEDSKTEEVPLEEPNIQVGTPFPDGGANDASIRRRRVPRDMAIERDAEPDMLVEIDPTCPEDGENSLPFVDLNLEAEVDESGERFTYQGVLSDADSAQASCSNPRQKSNDRLLRFVPPAPGNWQITTDLPGTQFDTVLYARPTCFSDETEELACSDDIVERENLSSRIQLALTEDTPTYIVTDSYRVTEPLQFEISAQKILTLETVEIFHNTELGSVGLRVTGTHAVNPLVGLNIGLIGAGAEPLDITNSDRLTRFYSLEQNEDGTFSGQWSARVPDDILITGVTVRAVDETGLRSQELRVYDNDIPVPAPEERVAGSACDPLHGVSTCQGELLCTDAGCATAQTECPQDFGVGVVVAERKNGQPTGSFVATGSTEGSELISLATCGGGSGLRVYRFTAPRSGLFHLETSAPEGDDPTMDTVLYARSHCGLSDLRVELGCNDDIQGGRTSALNLDLVEGQEIFVFVDGYLPPGEASGWTGAFQLRITPVSTPVLHRIDAVVLDQPDAIASDCLEANCPLVRQPTLLTTFFQGSDRDRDAVNFEMELKGLGGVDVLVNGQQRAVGPFDRIEWGECGEAQGYAFGAEGCFELIGCPCEDATCDGRAFASREACAVTCEGAPRPDCTGALGCPAGMICQDVPDDGCDPQAAGDGCPGECLPTDVLPCAEVAPDSIADPVNAASFQAYKTLSLHREPGDPSVQRVGAYVADQLGFRSGLAQVVVRLPAEIAQGQPCDPVGVMSQCVSFAEVCMPNYDRDPPIVPLPDVALVPTEPVSEAAPGGEGEGQVEGQGEGQVEGQGEVAVPAPRATALPDVDDNRCRRLEPGCPAVFAPVDLNAHAVGADWIYRGDTTGNEVVMPSPCDRERVKAQSVAHFVAPQAGAWRFTVRGIGAGGGDTVLMARDHCVAPDESHILGCNDDAPGQGVSSQLDLRLEAGQAVYLFMGGFGDWEGPFELQATAVTRFCQDHYVCRGTQTLVPPEPLEGCVQGLDAPLRNTCQPATCREAADCPEGQICDATELNCRAPG